jgi:hypothetical protein
VAPADSLPLGAVVREAGDRLRLLLPSRRGSRASDPARWIRPGCSRDAGRRRWPVRIRQPQTCCGFEIFVWDTGTFPDATPRAVLRGHQAEATHVEFNYRGDLLANAGEPTAHESLPLAMTCRQRGEDAEAREWYEPARRWRERLLSVPVSVTTELDALFDEASASPIKSAGNRTPDNGINVPLWAQTRVGQDRNSTYGSGRRHGPLDARSLSL